MVALPVMVNHDPTLEAADRAMEQAALRPARPSFGMGALGDTCSRKIWYRYHTPKQEIFSAATLRKFADGHASEAVVINRIRAVQGVTLLSLDPETGRQFAIEAFESRLRGFMDGAILGLLQSPRTWHCFEVKATNEKSFAKLLKAKTKLGDKSALQEWNPVYFAQAQLYMGYAELERHYTVVCTPGVRDWTSMRTEFDPIAFALLQDKAKRILEATAPLARVSNDPCWFECRFCNWRQECHGVAE